MQYSTDRRISDKVRELVADGWEVRTGRKHPVIIAPSGRRIAIPVTPSDHRSALNWLSAVRKLN